MSRAAEGAERLRFLARVVQRECSHLEQTDRRLFDAPFTVERVRRLDNDPLQAERVEAFVARFGRLQDTPGDKLVPALLHALGEPRGAVMDNLDRAERLGWIPSADAWLAVRKLRNQMIHEYIEDPLILGAALQAGHEHVPMLLAAGGRLMDELRQRGWLSTQGEAQSQDGGVS